MPPIKVNMPVIKDLVCQLILNHSIYFFRLWYLKKNYKGIEGAPNAL